MENEILKRISSKYILRLIPEYIKDENFMLKFFSYSKYFQKKLGIELSDYINKHIERFEKLGLKVESFLKFQNYFTKDYDKNILSIKLNNELNKYRIDVKNYQKYSNNYFTIYENNYKKNNLKYNLIEYNENSEKIININSPIFDPISKTNSFNLFFTIEIPLSTIKEFNLINDYKSIFQKMNELNINYSSLSLFFLDGNNINYLNELNIDFNKIKRLNIYPNYFSKDNQEIYKNLFSIKNLRENLIYLNLGNNSETPNISFINELISLEQLILYDFTNFKLKLKNLKILTLKNCSYVSLDQNIGKNMKKFVIFNCKINLPKILLQLPELEECFLKNKDIVFSKIIDFKSLKKLKKILINSYAFSEIDNNSQIEDIELYELDGFINKNIIKKICSFKTIKNINLELKKIKEIIMEVISPCESVTNMTIKIETISGNGLESINNLYKIFPNLLKIIIDVSNKNYFYYNYFNEIKIEENINSKIKEIYCNISKKIRINIYCQSFETVKALYIKAEENLINFDKVFPVFNNKCDINLVSLNYLHIEIQKGIDVIILENIYNNIDKLPNLKYLYLDFIISDINIKKQFYDDLIKKILDLDLKYLYVKIENESLKSESKIFKYNFGYDGYNNK